MSESRCAPLEWIAPAHLQVHGTGLAFGGKAGVMVAMHADVHDLEPQPLARREPGHANPQQQAPERLHRQIGAAEFDVVVADRAEAPQGAAPLHGDAQRRDDAQVQLVGRGFLPAVEAAHGHAGLDEQMVAFAAGVLRQRAVVVDPDVAQARVALGALQRPVALERLLRSDVAAGEAVQAGTALDVDAAAMRANVVEVRVRRAAASAVPHPVDRRAALQQAHALQLDQRLGGPRFVACQCFGDREAIQQARVPITDGLQQGTVAHRQEVQDALAEVQGLRLQRQQVLRGDQARRAGMRRRQGLDAVRQRPLERRAGLVLQRHPAGPPVGHADRPQQARGVGHVAIDMKAQRRDPAALERLPAVEAALAARAVGRFGASKHHHGHGAGHHTRHRAVFAGCLPDRRPVHVLVVHLVPPPKGMRRGAVPTKPRTRGVTDVSWHGWCVHQG